MFALGVVWALLQLTGLVLVIAIAVWGYFRWDRRYHGSQATGPAYERTEETFQDPTTGRMMRVFFNPSTGERQYRTE